MAKRQRSKRREENLSDFAGPDANRDAIEKLASAAKAANEKAGKNTGEISDEALARHINLIDAAELEWREARDKAAELQSVLRNRYKVAKGDGVDIDALKLAKRIKERVSGEVVAEQRNVGRYLRIMGAPIGTQWTLFDEPTPEVAKLDATAAGEAAGLNAEPKENNPHTPGGDDWFAWNNGHQIGSDRLADNLRTGTTRGNGAEAAAA